MTTGSWSEGGEARRVRIYLGEEDTINRMPAYHAVVAILRRHNAAGVTVFRGLEGFGASGRIHSASLAEVPWDLPTLVEWVDTPPRVAHLLPELKKLVPAGMITVDATEVILFAARSMRTVSATVTAEAVMTKDVATVPRDAPVHDVIELMRRRSLRGVPVVDAGIVVGMITNSDLVRRAGLESRPSMRPTADAGEYAKQVADLPRLVAEDVMTAPPVVTAPTASLREVAETMVRRRLKRLPVVDERGSLLGIVSRVDLLRTVGDFGKRDESRPTPPQMHGDVSLGSVMREDVPLVYPDSPLGDVVQAVISTRLNRALVVDADRHVLGIVTAKAVLERATPTLHPGLIRSLIHRLPLLRPTADELESERHGGARKASELMTNDLLRAGPSDGLRSVIAAMVQGAQKLVAVVDENGRLLGVVDRADVLRGIIDHLD